MKKQLSLILASALALPAVFALFAPALSSAPALPAAVPDTAATAPIRVLTFNILASQPGWEKDAKCEPWAVRKPIVLEVMRNRAGGAPCDFIGTQETSVHPDAALNQVNQLAAEMTGFGSLYAACSGEKNGPVAREFSLSNMIFWRKDRWEPDPRDHGTFWLSDTPETPGSNQWSPSGKGGKRNVTYGLFHEIAGGKRTGRQVYFFNTHLNVHVPDARAKSAFLIMERIRARKNPSAPVILTGDFNSRRDSLVYKYLTGSPVDFDGRTRTPPLALTEAFAKAGRQDDLPRIDFIFTTAGLAPRSAAKIRVTRDGVRPSDHDPVEAALEWK
jgi:endonuclease/exonuclease/phosphatase family metal-dependent hydrolase